MSIYRPSPQRRVLLAALILASVTVITLDFRSSGALFGGARGAVGAVLSPAKRAASAVVNPITSFFSGIVHAGSVRAENEKLRSENAQLRAQSDELTRLRAENEALQGLNALPIPPEIQTVGARVFASGASTLEFTIEIDAGSNRGLEVGYPVVSGDGLVGRVIQVYGQTSIVQLVNDPRFHVGVRLPNGTTGVVNGEGPSPMTLDLVDSKVVINRGDRLFTVGGTASGFPPNIPVGTVRELPPADPSLQRVVPVDPAMKRGDLQLVKVLIYSGTR